MKEFFIVFKFEFLGMLKKKAFIISTVLLCSLIIIGLFIPTINNTFFNSNDDNKKQISSGNSKTYGYIDKTKQITNIEDVKKNFTIGQLKEISSIDRLEEKVNSDELQAGFIIQSHTNYYYIVKNNEMLDSSQTSFEKALAEAYRIKELKERGINYSQVSDLIKPSIKSQTKILGKDSASNYLYTYILVFGLYFMIIIYGQLTATSVASEKSNRTMEILITSTRSRNLIFGKVLGGALAGVTQFGLIILTAKVFYEFNADAWNHRLDFVFNIPMEVLLSFSMFGVLGYLFYSFIYGALGALVSRTEDVSSSSTPITILFIGVFFASTVGMQHPDGILLKVVSFLPFSSFMAMFVRISMGTVSTLEIIISLLILLVSTVLVGIFGAMIYRMGTLMYGNPVKFRDVIKLLRQQ